MPDIIDTLSAMSDAELSAKLGFDAKIEMARKSLADAAALTGDARKCLADKFEQDFAPRTPYIEDWAWKIKDAQREAAKTAKSATDEMCDCDPASLMPSDD